MNSNDSKNRRTPIHVSNHGSACFDRIPNDPSSESIPNADIQVMLSPEQIHELRTKEEMDYLKNQLNAHDKIPTRIKMYNCPLPAAADEDSHENNNSPKA